MCPINDGMDDKKHFLLLCNLFKEHRNNLLACVNNKLEAHRYSEAPDNAVLQLLLYENKNLSLEGSRLILSATAKHIFETVRFD